VQGSDIMKKVTHPYDLELAELHARLIKDIHE
jgi:2-C-methyl-D-erythritol 4-phosphate cytidylyltransferase